MRPDINATAIGHERVQCRHHWLRLGGLGPHPCHERHSPWTGYRQFEAFFNALAQGREMPLTSLAEAARSHEVIFAADRSAELGRPVRVAE